MWHVTCNPWHMTGGGRLGLCLAWGEEELPPFLPLGHGGDCLWAGTGPSNYHNLNNFHSRYLQQGPGPCDGLQEEGQDQQQQCHHDHLDARAARMEPHCSRILFQAVCGKSFAERVLRNEFAERVMLAADWVIVQCWLSNRSGGMSSSLCEKSFAERVRKWRVPIFRY